MREIKFRGKRINNGKWLYGDLMHNNIGGCYIYPIECENLYKENAVLPEAIGQFTGLRDKNGKDIYEGDILYAVNLRMPSFYHNGTLYKGMGGKFEVVYEGCGFYLKNKEGHCINFLSDWEYEIIGNIYDNKNLIEG